MWFMALQALAETSGENISKQAMEEVYLRPRPLQMRCGTGRNKCNNFKAVSALNMRRLYLVTVL